MTIIWCGGEDIDTFWTDGGGTYNSYDGSFARISPQGGHFFNKFTPVSTCWMSVKIYPDTWANRGCVSLRDSNTGALLGIGQGTSANRINLFKQGATRIILQEETTGRFTAGVKIDINLINYSTNGSVKVYANGILAIDYTGDIVSYSATSFDHIYNMHETNLAISELIVADEDTRLMRLKTLAPSATGDTNSWSGSYADIDDISISDADKLYTSTPDADALVNLTGMPSGNYTPLAVKLNTRFVNEASQYGLQQGVKTNGSIYLSDTQQSLKYWGNKEVMFHTNPITGLPWTSAEIEALQFAYRHKVIA
jgi:hypothetical protein